MVCYACACRPAPYVHGYPAAALIDYVPVSKSHYVSKKNDLFFNSQDKYATLTRDVEEEIANELSKKINRDYLNIIISVLNEKISETAKQIDANYEKFSDTLNKEAKTTHAENFGYKYMLLMRYIWIIEQIAKQIKIAVLDVKTAHKIYAEKEKLKKESDITDYWTQKMKYAFDSVSRLCTNALVYNDREILLT